MAEITIWAKMVTEIAKVVGNWQVGKEKRKYDACIEAAQQYIFVNEEGGGHKNISDERKEKLLAHYRKRFFTYD